MCSSLPWLLASRSALFLLVAQAMHDADELLEWLCVALDWLGGGGDLAEHLYRPVLQVSAELYRARWHLLLPCEQEHAVDLALALVCAAWSPQGVHLDPTSVRDLPPLCPAFLLLRRRLTSPSSQIVFTRFWHDIVREQQPAVRPYPLCLRARRKRSVRRVPVLTKRLSLQHLDALRAAHERIKVAVDHVRGLYNVGVGMSSFAGFGIAQEATEWATDFLSPAGVSEQKALRMDLRALEAVTQQLDELRDELFALARAGDRALPPVTHLVRTSSPSPSLPSPH